MNSWWFIIALWIFIAFLIVCPPKYDPAIRLKKWNEKWAAKLDERDKK